jgi:hypothetical protein
MNEDNQTVRMQIFFKSGNSVIIDGVLEYDSASRDGALTRVSFKQQGATSQTWLDVESLDIRSVEAIVRLPVLPSTLPTREA